MRLAHHLALIGSTYYFRITTPPDLRPALGRRYLKHSLRTGDLPGAKALAYHLAAAYLQRFAALRGDPLNRKPGDADLDAFLSGLGVRTDEMTRFELGQGVDERGRIRAFVSNSTDAADYKRGAKEADKVNRQNLKPSPRLAVINAASAVPSVPSMKLSAAIVRFHNKFGGGKTQGGKNPDTMDKYRKHQDEFLTHVGDRNVETIERHHLDEFREYLKNERHNSVSTIANKFTPLTLLFSFLIKSGYYAKGNPAAEQATLTKAQKVARSQAFGRQAYTPDEIQKIFDPANYAENTEPAEYYAPLIQLFTGCRANEACQLTVNDFKRLQDRECFLIMDTEAKQSVKGEASKRIVPIHPALLTLGLWDYVERVRAAGYTYLFPYLTRAKNRFSGRQLKAFDAYLKQVKVDPKRRIGTHSFRKTVVQMLQGADASPKHATRYVGHAFPGLGMGANDVHTLIYQSAEIIAPMADHILPRIKFDIDLQGLKRDPSVWDRFLDKKWVEEERKDSENRKENMKNSKTKSPGRPPSNQEKTSE